MKIYDCFPLFNELDLLHIRLELLYDHVDYFVISECDSTFSGLDKPFNFELNRGKFKKYEDKIIYLQHHDSKNIDIIDQQSNTCFKNIVSQYNAIKNTALTDFGKPHWCREYLHREYIALGLDACNEEDFIIFGDLDEIPKTNKLIFEDCLYTLKHQNMLYYINKENTTEPWYGNIIFKYKQLHHNTLQQLRVNRPKYNIIENGGWHLTHMGGINRIAEKIRSYGHQEFNNAMVINNLTTNVQNNKDIFNRNMSIQNIDINKYYPDSMINFIKQNYGYLIG